MMTNDALTFGEKLRFLIENARSVSGEATNIDDFISLSGMSRQGVFNLLNGESTDPRISTLRQICSVYGVSLDYFSCQTEDDCLLYLLNHANLNAEDVQSIHEQRENLSQKNLQSVINLLGVIGRGMA